MKPLELNWNQRIGKFNHSCHEFEMALPSRDYAINEIENIYDGLKNFDHFNGIHNDIAVKTTRTVNGIRFVFFDSKGFFGFLSDRINAKQVPVRVWSRKSDYLIVGDTAEGHMLVGQRRWRATQTTATSILVTTESYDQPCGRLNRWGMKLMGASRQLRVWRVYLANIRDQYVSPVKLTNVAESHTPGIVAESPWPPENPYPGVEIL